MVAGGFVVPDKVGNIGRVEGRMTGQEGGDCLEGLGGVHDTLDNTLVFS